MVCQTPFYATNSHGREVPVPCGRCADCLKRRVDSWAFRLLKEEEVSTSSYFVTLTYRTDVVPLTNKGFMDLSRSDLQKFFKRLRKHDKRDQKAPPIRYYACGEYGTRNWRPHYHAIIFNVADPESIFKAWTLGEIHVGNVSGASITYTLKYICKPARIPRFHGDDRTPEFSLMSKRLGSSYLSESVIAYHQADLSRTYCTLDGGAKIALPRYYRNLIYTKDQQLEQAEIAETEVGDISSKRMRDFHDMYGEDADYHAFCKDLLTHKRNSLFSSSLKREL